MMNDQPSILIRFDPQTWEGTAVYFKAETDEETRKLQEILAAGIQSETNPNAESLENAD